MSKRCTAAVVLMTAVLIICQIFPVKAADDENLYALSAVLMDGETGRVLYGKEAYKGRPNASTTKVMTCILALELAKGDDYVQVSGNAASQPQTRLGMREGQQFYLEDLLYSLMLKSHNDSAVAIAEHIGGSVEGFAEKMNEKAKELGCKDTHFVTPNGLDGEDEGGIHHTTARDLALIMAYAIKNATFVHITQTRDYTFTDISGKKHYSVHNTNAFLDMETGVISGKTGFTGNAGYCYVCAVRQDERLFIVALLGCGWPGNKNYKWSDTKKLLSYGRENYQYVMLPELPQLPDIPVKYDGIPGGSRCTPAGTPLAGCCIFCQFLQRKSIQIGSISHTDQCVVRKYQTDGFDIVVIKNIRIESLIYRLLSLGITDTGGSIHDIGEIRLNDGIGQDPGRTGFHGLHSCRDEGRYIIQRLCIGSIQLTGIILGKKLNAHNKSKEHKKQCR